MNIRTTTFRNGLVVLAAVALTLSTAIPAHAETPSEADQLAQIVAEAADQVGSSGEVTPTEADPTGSLVGTNGNLTANIDEGAVAVAFNEGAAVTVGLPPEADPGDPTLANDGTVVFASARNAVDVSVQVLDDGVRIATVIHDADQPTVYTYPLPEGTYPVLNADGSGTLVARSTVVDPDTGAAATLEAVIAEIEAPWAQDATGNAVATRFEIRDEDLVQIVDHRAGGTTYPVVADPKITQPNVFQTLIRWNRAETATIAASGWGATGLTAVCVAAGVAIGGPPIGAVFGAACFAISGSGVYTAGVAQNSNPKKCLQLTITHTVISAPVPWFDTYKGGTCK